MPYGCVLNRVSMIKTNRFTGEPHLEKDRGIANEEILNFPLHI